VELKRPFNTGVWFGIGLMCAPVVLGIIIYSIMMLAVFIFGILLD